MSIGMLILVLSLGIDSLFVSAFLGMLQTKGKAWRVVIAFCTAETSMPLLDILLGQTAHTILGHTAPVIGAGVLILLATYLVFFKEENDDPVEFEMKGWPLLLASIGISVDGLAVGFSLGLLRIPIPLTISIITVEVLIFTLCGIMFGRRIQPLWGASTEGIVGMLLMFVGWWIIFSS